MTSTTEMKIISSKDFETLCQQPIAIGTVISMIGLIPIHVISMFVLFTKANNLYNPNYIKVNIRRHKFANHVVPF